MHIVERFWATLTSLFSIVTLSPVQDVFDGQTTLQIAPEAPKVAPHVEVAKGPRFTPPGTPQKDFECVYPSMIGWEKCSTPTSRQCWLRRTSDGKQYDINTDYENDMPIGITRYYNITLEDSWFAADGLNFTAAKLFNDSYPGPWLEACWGDTVIVNVTNILQYNGTSVHWHGIRQNQTMHMDGVNGITQCPIAPQDYFVYNFTATQYGSSWYHSHYSVQYADGAVGPLTLHGPTSADFDEAISPPIIMTDWGHNEAFVAVSEGLENPDILLNGQGNITKYDNTVKNTTEIKPPYQITFHGSRVGRPCRKYLLRIINTSFDTTFVFSIDNHLLQIVSSDFVPIQPYKNTSVLVGIGQRYNVIVEANPIAHPSSPLPADGNYWIRTFISPCGGPPNASPHYEETGILRYDDTSIANPSTKQWDDISTTCADENYASLHPILPWKVQNPVNGKSGEGFDLFRQPDPKKYPLAKWNLDTPATPFSPIRVNWSDPTFFHLDNTGAWDPFWRIVPENYTSKDWVYLVVKGQNSRWGAHPIHLHGHDFAILEQAYNKAFDPNNLNLKLDNPPRRDVVLMPSSGYVVIAFKTDNPGAWLVHCHITFHISEGLGLQIMERQRDANAIWPKGNSKALEEAGRVCDNWDQFYNNPSNWAVPPKNCSYTNKEWCFQDDSGV